MSIFSVNKLNILQLHASLEWILVRLFLQFVFSLVNSKTWLKEHFTRFTHERQCMQQMSDPTVCFQYSPYTTALFVCTETHNKLFINSLFTLHGGTGVCCSCSFTILRNSEQIKSPAVDGQF